MDDTQLSRINRILSDALADAGSRHTAARKRFDCEVEKVPWELPHPDDAQRIHVAGKEVNAALEGYLNALKRYTDFVLYRIVPADLTETPPD